MNSIQRYLGERNEPLTNVSLLEISISLSPAKSCIPATGRCASCNEINGLLSRIVMIFTIFLCRQK